MTEKTANEILLISLSVLFKSIVCNKVDYDVIVITCVKSDFVCSRRKSRCSYNVVSEVTVEGSRLDSNNFCRPTIS